MLPESGRDVRLRVELARRADVAVRHGFRRLVVGDVHPPPFGRIAPDAPAFDARERVDRVYQLLIASVMHGFFFGAAFAMAYWTFG